MLEINSYYQTIHKVKLFGWLGVFGGLVLLAVKLNMDVIPLWTYVALPFIFTLLIFQVSMHYILRSMNWAAKSFPTTLLLFCNYNFGLSTILVLTLGALKLDEVMSLSWSLIMIAVWYDLFIYGVVTGFLLPGLLSPQVNMKREAYLLFGYFIAILLFTIFLASFLDNQEPSHFWIVLLPPLTITSLHFLSFVISKPTELCNGEAHFIYCLFSFFLLYFLRETLVENISDWVLVGVFMGYLLVWLVSEQVNYFKITKTDGLLLE